MIHSPSEFELFDLGNNKKISVAALRRLQNAGGFSIAHCARNSRWHLGPAAI